MSLVSVKDPSKQEPQAVKADWAAKKAIKPTVSISLSKHYKPECGPMPNVLVALPNIGGALCSTPQSLADAHYAKPVEICRGAPNSRTDLSR